MEIHRGRLLDHVHLVVRDIDASRRFYRAVLEALEVPMGGEASDYFWADELFVSTAEFQGARGELTGRAHLGLQAKSREMVDQFYRAALGAGGRDNGSPGERPYHPGYYAAFVLDPDGNNIEAVHHGPAKQSAQSVVFSF